MPAGPPVSAETEVSALHEQVRRLENRLAYVLRNQDEPRQKALLAVQPLVPLPPLAIAGSVGPEPPKPAHQRIHMLKDGSEGQGRTSPGGPAEDCHPGRTRYIGPGHWMNGALMAMMKPLLREVMGKKATSNSSIQANMETCKALGRTIKERRAPVLVPALVGRHLPDRALADSLVNSYFRTFETVFRILHIPSFMKNYRRYGEAPDSASPGFVVQMQLCMAIGVFLHDDVASLRKLATQWIHEGQVWLTAPAVSEKSRMTIPNLQTMCLLHLAREISGIGGDLSWVSAGHLVRSAMYMGLHRDPTHIPRVPRFLAEIRRRLWAVVLELTLQSSLDSGGPPLLTLADFDTQPPSNYFDDQLDSPADSAPTTSPDLLAPKPLTTFTDTSVQIALTKSFPTRLAIARHVNDFRNNDAYDAVLRLNAELRSACQSLSATLQSFRPSARGGLRAGYIRPSTFQLRFLEHLTQRSFLSLNQAYLAASQTDPKFYFSRKVSVDTALKLHRAWSNKPPSAAAATDTAATGDSASVASAASSPWAAATNTSGDGHSSHSSHGGHGGARGPLFQTALPSADTDDEPDDFSRLSVVAAGAFRSVAMQCIATLSMELVWQLEEEHALRLSLGLEPGGSDKNPDGTGNGVARAPADDEASNHGDDAHAAPPADSHAASILAMPGVVSQSVLLEAIEQAVRFTDRRIHAGETNIKGYMFTCAVLAQARALVRGASKADVERAVLADGQVQLNHCVELLRAVAARPPTGESPLAEQTAAAYEEPPPPPPPLPHAPPNPDLVSGWLSADSADMADFGDMLIPPDGQGWEWDSLLQDGAFNFNLNMNYADPFAGI